MFIAMAGLPGTGKSTLARRLAESLAGVVLDKDVIRTALFPQRVLDYTREQDDTTMAAIYAAAVRILTTHTNCPVIVDGRTYSRAYQVRDLFTAANQAGQQPIIIECISSDEVIRARLERDRAAGGHPAGNRTFGLYQRVKASAEPLELARLVLDTGKLPLDECARRCLEYINQRTHPIGGLR